MGKYLSRMVNMSQRRVSFEREDFKSHAALEHFTIHIQGITRISSGLKEETTFWEMAEHAISHWHIKPLSLYDRLLRRKSQIGSMQRPDEDRIIISFFSQPEILFELDLANDNVYERWKEALVIIRAAGFDLKEDP